MDFVFATRVTVLGTFQGEGEGEGFKSRALSLSTARVLEARE